MRFAIMSSRYLSLSILMFALITAIGSLSGDQLGPYIGYIADSRYDEIIQQLLLRASMEYEKARLIDPDSAENTHLR